MRGGWSLPERSFPCAARPASPLRSTLRASPVASSGSSICMDIWCLAFPRCTSDFALLTVRPFARRAVHHPRSLRLLRPLLTPRSATCHSVRQRRPFRHKARSPQVRTMTFSAQPPDLHHLSLGRGSFAVTGPLALLGSASYPVLVHRLADSLAASFSAPVALGALRFTWVAATSSPKDFHLQAITHAGHTRRKRRPLAAASRFLTPRTPPSADRCKPGSCPRTRSPRATPWARTSAPSPTEPETPPPPGCSPCPTPRP